MKRETYENIVRAMKAGDSLHHRAAAELNQDPGDADSMDRVIAGALLAIDRRMASVVFGWMDEARERVEEDEATETDDADEVRT